jgi:hypothetical protein
VGGIIGAVVVVGVAVGAILLLRRKKSNDGRQSKAEIRVQEPTDTYPRDTHPTMSYSTEAHRQEQGHNDAYLRPTQSPYGTEMQYPPSPSSQQMEPNYNSPMPQSLSVPSPRQTAAAPQYHEPDYNVPMSRSLPSPTTKDFYRDTQFRQSQSPTSSSVPGGIFDYTTSRPNLETSDGGEFLPSYKAQCQTVLSVPMAVAVFPESGSVISSVDP